MYHFLLFSPLDQYDLIACKIIIFHSQWVFELFLNSSIFVIVMLWCIYNFYYKCYSNFLHFKSTSWQKMQEFLFGRAIKLLNTEKYFPVIFTLFNFILFSNLIGLIPHMFTLTSHLIVTFALSFSVFIGVTILILEKYKMKTFSLFLPVNSNFFLALMLVPIEFLSYLARPISLGIWLFMNLMAGHTLLKVVIGFAWSMVLVENLMSFGLIIPMVILLALFCLELAVALIQTYVFVVLTCIYIQEGS